MTKEELIQTCFEICRDKKISSDAEYLVSTIEKFFKDKVIIQHGDNRHPYADILHEWIEGADIEFEKSNGDYTNMPSVIDYFNTEFRSKSKPKEPVYEWQWLAFNCHDNSVRDFLNYAKFMTELEAATHYVERVNTKIYKISKIEETKRERK